jgi:hypothetical protein
MFSKQIIIMLYIKIINKKELKLSYFGCNEHNKEILFAYKIWSLFTTYIGIRYLISSNKCVYLLSE